jgi:transaldolase
MEIEKTASDLSLEIEAFIKSSFKPQFGQLTERFETDPTWQRLREIGSELWLDTGSIGDSQELWTREFSALTTNNTLLNREVQTGRYDSLICEAAQMLSAYPHLTEHQRMLELAFILNAWHGLRLVETFDAYVSVEEHTALAHDVDQSVDYARRYHTICPERFIVKIPLTPAGLLATRRVSADGIPVNHTLGFSARQNYMIARIGRPAFVNVFLGRLNSFVVGNDLGDGGYVGEKATLASQAAIRDLRQRNLAPTRQIGASFRSGAQVRDLAGIDVMTMPPKVASEFLSIGMSPDQITDKTAADYSPGMSQNVDREAIRLDTLWDIDNELVACLDALDNQDIGSFTPDELTDFFAEHGCADVLVRWGEAQIETSTVEGKIPKLQNWRDTLANKSIGLDSLMNLAGLRSFATDQKAMDDRVRQVLDK